MISYNGVGKNLKYGFSEGTIIDGWAKKYEPVMTYLGKLNSRQGKGRGNKTSIY
jgi:hypothetical protein